MKIRTLAGGRRIPADDCTEGTVIWDALDREAPMFKDPEDLARWVGHFYGWRSTTPTHLGIEMDGVAWWTVEAMADIYADTTRGAAGRHSYFELVHGLESMTSGEHARCVLVALEAAGFTLVPAEAAP